MSKQWEIKTDSVSDVIRIYEGNKLVCKVIGTELSREDLISNTLLISKAPEMLEKLIEISNELKDLVESEKERKDINKLIKGATEL